jgi:hypothetical protein
MEPVMACTWIPETIIPALEELLLDLVYVTVIVEAVTTVLPIVINVPVAVVLPTPALNLRLVGAVKIIVLFAWFLGKSFDACDFMIISPNVVYPAPLLEFAALSAEILVQLIAAVTNTEK